jgi:hypothetical protein
LEEDNFGRRLMVCSRLQPDGKTGNTRLTDNRNILVNVRALSL